MTADVPQKLWYVGILIVSFSSFAGAFGHTLMKQAYNDTSNKQQKIPNRKRTSICKNVFWITGFILSTIIDPIASFIALNFAPATLISPFAGANIFWCIVLSKLWLGETITNAHIYGCTAIVFGVVMSVVFGHHGVEITHILSLSKYIANIFSIGYLFVCFFIFLTLTLLWLDIFSGRFLVCYIGLIKFSSMPTKLQVLIISFNSGICGGNVCILIKILGIITRHILTGDYDALSDWRTYVVAIATIFLSLLQLLFLIVGLRRFDAGEVIPITNSFLVISNNVGAIILLNEKPSNDFLFLVGVISIVLGLMLLVLKKKKFQVNSDDVQLSFDMSTSCKSSTFQYDGSKINIDDSMHENHSDSNTDESNGPNRN